MVQALFVKENIVHIAAALYLVGFLFRGQIMLRTFVIAGDLVYISYFYCAPEVPLGGGVFLSAIFMLGNVAMIARVVAGRTSFRMNGEERQLFDLLGTLSPGEFRQLIRLGRWRTATETTVLAEQDQPLEQLYYVLDGNIAVEKSGCAPRLIGPHAFIGEVAFLLHQPASATVTLSPGARYVTWDRAALCREQLRAPSLAVALSAALNRDMAAKVARS